MVSVSADPAVSGLDEFDAEASILLVSVAVVWHRWSLEVIERHKKSHRGAVISDQVLQHEEFDISPEVLEQCEKVAVSRQRLTEWAELAEVVPTDALKRGLQVRSERGGEEQFRTNGFLEVLPRFDALSLSSTMKSIQNLPCLDQDAECIEVATTSSMQHSICGLSHIMRRLY